MSFHHEAFFYSGEKEYLAGTLSFVREGVAAGEPVLVAIAADRGAELARRLGAAAERVEFADMEELGRNPARILPAWQAFVERAGGRPARGVGEPAWPGRSDAEICECHRHEALLNVAFEDARDFRLVCPYDAAGLAPEVLDEARRTHPMVAERGLPMRSGDYMEPALAPGPFVGELPPPAAEPETRRITLEALSGIRAFLSDRATSAGLALERTRDLQIAVTELVTNVLRHGGGTGCVSIWREDGVLCCEVAGGGVLGNPLTGRIRPDPAASGGWGLWLVNHLCDLVQVRSGGSGTVVRVRMALPPAPDRLEPAGDSMSGRS